MSKSTANPNTESGTRTISLIVSVAVHLMLLAGIPSILGENKTGPAESSSALRISVHRSQPTDDTSRENPDLGKQALAQTEVNTAQSQKTFLQSIPESKAIIFHNSTTKTPVKHAAKTTPTLRTTATAQPASDRKGAEVKEIRPMQTATSGKYSRLTRDYRSTLLRLIERHKYYPIPARRKGLEGTSTVAFSVSRNGNISGIALARSSGVSLLDQAALQAIKRIGSAPPFPKDIQRRQWHFTIPIAYSLR